MPDPRSPSLGRALNRATVAVRECRLPVALPSGALPACRRAAIAIGCNEADSLIAQAEVLARTDASERAADVAKVPDRYVLSADSGAPSMVFLRTTGVYLAVQAPV